MNLQIISDYQKLHKEKWLKLLIKNEEDDLVNVLNSWMCYIEHKCNKCKKDFWIKKENRIIHNPKIINTVYCKKIKNNLYQKNYNIIGAGNIEETYNGKKIETFKSYRLGYFGLCPTCAKIKREKEQLKINKEKLKIIKCKKICEIIKICWLFCVIFMFYSIFYDILYDIKYSNKPDDMDSTLSCFLITITLSLFYVVNDIETNYIKERKKI